MFLQLLVNPVSHRNMLNQLGLLLLIFPLSWELHLKEWKFIKHHTRDLRHSSSLANHMISRNLAHPETYSKLGLVPSVPRQNSLDVPIEKIFSTVPPAKFFIGSNHTVALAQIGATATLHCEVLDIGENTISWIRRKDYQLLTVGLTTYSSDDRFFTIHGKNPQDWALHIRFATEKDAGLYECQISTHPPISIFTELKLVEAQADIVGGPDKIVKEGSSLLLTCVVRKATESPAYVFWYRGDRMINYDEGGGAAVRHGRHGSELLIPQVDPRHAGNYSCVPSNAKQASVNVHVVQMEEPAAMQHEKNGAITLTINYTFGHIFCYMIIILQALITVIDR